ncbi:metal ABC transporter substrate-binding protein [Gulosibacter molinativorax]|uniref:metal ABC transporter substrate-binding protein n=1 Tax=Gulosibacter molinativorax TaxID=256821 RepID=UPI0003FB494F|nr:metal ABC transporter substrate-binding protein [Gulosibacter molinativorax]
MSHYTRRILTRTLTGGLAAVAITTGLVGCAAGSDAPAAADGLQIVTTTTQLTDFATNITDGTGAQITGLLQPNASAHSFEATAADLETIRTADVVIINGLGLEPWAQSTIDSAGFEGLLIDASNGISDDRILAANEDEHDHAAEEAAAEETHAEDSHDGHDHADETASAADAAAEDSHDGHDHGGDNPHIWTAPLMAADMTNEIASELANLDADQGDTYLANATAYNDKLTALDEWVKTNVDTVPAADRLLVSNHDALTYYDHDYGITFVGSVMPSWDDNAEPSAAEIDALVAAIKESGAQAIFTETQLSPGTAEAIATEAGIKIYSGEDGLYTDSLGAEGTAGDTYIKSTIHNTTQLLDSWGGAASEPPAELQES